MGQCMMIMIMIIGDNGNDYDNERKHGKCLMIVFGKRNKIDASIF